MLNQRHRIQFGNGALHCVACCKNRSGLTSLCSWRVTLQPGGIKDAAKTINRLCSHFSGSMDCLHWELSVSCSFSFYHFFSPQHSSSLPRLYSTVSQAPFLLRCKPLILTFEFRQNSEEWISFFLLSTHNYNCLFFSSLFTVCWLPALEKRHCLLDQHLSPQC